MSTEPICSTMVSCRMPSLLPHDRSELTFDGVLFISEQIRGTLQPSTICDVNFYGMSSPSVGTISNPGNQHLYWNIEGPLRCSQQFIPGANQSIALTIRSLNRLSKNTECQTQCGDGGCVCVSLSKSSKSYDHLVLISEEGHPLTCLCGDFQVDYFSRFSRSSCLQYSLPSHCFSTSGCQ